MSEPPANPFDRIADLYDWEHDGFTEDVALYEALVRQLGGPVLELACGTGRILAPLAAAGFACTGVDSSAAMLARAERRLAGQGARAVLLQQRLQELRLAGPFRSILLPLDGLALLLSRADQEQALRGARAVASHDARLVVDVSNGNLRGGAEPVSDLFHQLTAPFPPSDDLVTKWVVREPDPVEQVDHLLLFYDRQAADGAVRRVTVPLRLRWFTRLELELVLERCGWEPVDLYGGYDLAPFGPTSERIIVVARPSA